MLSGILLTARIIAYALKKMHDNTMGFLTGLVVGSLYALWPFKTYQVEDVYMKGKAGIEFFQAERLYTNVNAWPGTLGLGLSCGLIVLVGVGAMWALSKLEAKG